MRLLERLFRLSVALSAGTWAPGGYRRFDVLERGKVRHVSAAPFVDRVVHHAVVDALAPVWERRFLPWSCANRVGRGTHDAMQRARAAATRFRFALSVDVFRFFPSVDHGALKSLLRRHLKGPVVATCDQIVDSGVGVFAANEARPWVPHDEDVRGRVRPRGLPVGNQTSQFWANVVLHPVDEVIAQHVRPGAAVRYVDDFLLFDDDDKRLEQARVEIEGALAKLRLGAHPTKTRIVAVREGFTFVGYRIDERGVRLPRATVSRFHRRLHALQRAHRDGAVTWDEVRASVAGMTGHTAAAGLTNVMEQLLDEHPFAGARHAAHDVRGEDDADGDRGDGRVHAEEPAHFEDGDDDDP